MLIQPNRVEPGRRGSCNSQTAAQRSRLSRTYPRENAIPPTPGTLTLTQQRVFTIAAARRTTRAVSDEKKINNLAQPRARAVCQPSYVDRGMFRFPIRCRPMNDSGASSWDQDVERKLTVSKREVKGVRNQNISGAQHSAALRFTACEQPSAARYDARPGRMSIADAPIRRRPRLPPAGVICANLRNLRFTPSPFRRFDFLTFRLLDFWTFRRFARRVCWHIDFSASRPRSPHRCPSVPSVDPYS